MVDNEELSAQADEIWRTRGLSVRSKMFSSKTSHRLHMETKETKQENKMADKNIGTLPIKHPWARCSGLLLRAKLCKSS